MSASLIRCAASGSFTFVPAFRIYSMVLCFHVEQVEPVSACMPLGFRFLGPLGVYPRLNPKV